MSSTQENTTQTSHDPSSARPVPTNRRPSPLDEVLSRCPCGCACTTRPGDIQRNDSGGSSDFVFVDSGPTLSMSDDDEYNSHSIDGDQGATDGMTEVGDMGIFNLKVILTASAKHNRCTCPGGVLPNADDYMYPFTTSTSLEASGPMPPDSMEVEPAMTPTTLALSASAMSLTSGTGSDILLGTGAHLEYSSTLSIPVVSYFLTRPIPLTQERTSRSNSDAGLYSSHLSLGDIGAASDHSAYNV